MTVLNQEFNFAFLSSYHKLQKSVVITNANITCLKILYEHLCLNKQIDILIKCQFWTGYYTNVALELLFLRRPRILLPIITHGLH